MEIYPPPSPPLTLPLPSQLPHALLNAYLKNAHKALKIDHQPLVSYMKVSRLLCLLLRWPATASSVFELTEYFEMVFLEILPSPEAGTRDYMI